MQGVSPSLARTYDTMNYSNSGDVQLQIAAIMHCKVDTITLEVQNTQKQCGPNDSALFTIAHAVDLCCENDPTMLLYYQPKMREHLVECLQAKKIIHFPSRVCCPNKPLTISFAVYCICRLPDFEDENDNMARCKKFPSMVPSVLCMKAFQKWCLKLPAFIGNAANVHHQMNSSMQLYAG